MMGESPGSAGRQLDDGSEMWMRGVFGKAAGGGSERFVQREVEPAKEMLRRRT
jgi:hypothetical protein